MKTAIQKDTYDHFLSVGEGNRRFYFRPDDIIRLEASSNYTNIYFINRKKIVSARVLKDYEAMLISKGFVRTHRSHLINKKFISSVQGNRKIFMMDDSTAEISRRLKNKVMRSLERKSA